MVDPLRVVIFGNSFASRVQLPALRWAGSNDVVGIAGHDGEKARQTAAQFGIPHATTDYRDLLALAPDLVLVSTPVHLHREMTLAALDAGAAVLCEKPFALNVEEAQEMVSAAAGRAAFLDHQLRWSPHVRTLAELLAAGFIGDPWHLRFDMLLPPTHFRTRPWSWWFDATRGGGILGAIGSHMLDLVRWLFGEIDTVHGELGTFLAERADAEGRPHRVSADEYAHLSLGFESGLKGELTTSIALPSDTSFFLQVTGSGGTIQLVDGDNLRAGQTGEALIAVDVEPPLPEADAFGMAPGGLFARCLPLYLKDLLEALQRGDRHLTHAATFADGLAVQQVLDAARTSAIED